MVHRSLGIFVEASEWQYTVGPMAFTGGTPGLVIKEAQCLLNNPMAKPLARLKLPQMDPLPRKTPPIRRT